MKKILIDRQLGALEEGDLIAEMLDDDILKDIGKKSIEGYQIDKESRSEWEERNADYIKLASQVKETRNWPWPNASNVKHPLLAIACLQYQSRANQQLLPDHNIVKSKVIGEDKDGKKRQKGERIAKHMSYQLLDEMEDWADDMDMLFLVLPACGNVFKKTYREYDRNVSEVVLPYDLVINYYARSLEKASRKTHILYFYPNEIEEKFRMGEWLKPENAFGDAVIEAGQGKINKQGDETTGVKEPSTDPDAPHCFLEQHAFYDLDDDDYKEPVIILLHEETGHVVKILPRYTAEDIEFIGENEVGRITPEEYFTNFKFIPDMISKIYGQGFGSLLGPLNETANSLINQMLDAGTLANIPSGFISRGIRAKLGNAPFKIGEFKTADFTGNDIRKGVYQFEFKGPSDVLFKMLGLMLESGSSLSSVSEQMTGKSPGQNQPYQTTSDLLEQGQMVFNGINKRVHRSLAKEYKKIYALNKIHVTGTEYFTILDSDQQTQGEVNGTDYQDESLDVFPASDPKVISSQEKLQKEQGLFSLVQMGTVNKVEATRRYLVARGDEDIETLMKVPEPQPSFEENIKMKELEIKEKEVMGGQQLDQIRGQFQSLRDQSAAALNDAKQQIGVFQAETDRMKVENQTIKDAMKHEFEELKTNLNAKLKKYEIDKKGASK